MEQNPSSNNNLPIDPSKNASKTLYIDSKLKKPPQRKKSTESLDSMTNEHLKASHYDPQQNTVVYEAGKDSTASKQFIGQGKESVDKEILFQKSIAQSGQFNNHPYDENREEERQGEDARRQDSDDEYH